MIIEDILFALRGTPVSLHTLLKRAMEQRYYATKSTGRYSCSKKRRWLESKEN